MPSSAPTGAAGPGLCWKSARRKKTDSSPSRATAKKLMPISAQAGPRASASAASMSCSMVLLIERAALRIQKTIESQDDDGEAPTIASKSSWVRCGNCAPSGEDAGADEERERDGEQHADPDRRQPVASARSARGSRR